MTFDPPSSRGGSQVRETEFLEMSVTARWRGASGSSEMIKVFYGFILVWIQMERVLPLDVGEIIIFSQLWGDVKISSL